MDLILMGILAALMLASLLGVARAKEHPLFDRITAWSSHLLSSFLVLPALAYLSVNASEVWLIPFFGLVQMKITSIRTHSFYAEFLLLPLVTSQVYTLLFFEGLRETLAGPWTLFFVIVANALLFEGLRRSLESLSIKMGRMHWK